MTPKHIAHAGRRDHDAELPQLTDDAEIAPPRVLPRETKDDGHDIGIEPFRSDRLRTREGPVPTNEVTVPTHERCRRDAEGGLPLAEEAVQASPARRDQWGGPRTRHLATEHRELMT